MLFLKLQQVLMMLFLMLQQVLHEDVVPDAATGSVDVVAVGLVYVVDGAGGADGSAT